MYFIFVFLVHTSICVVYKWCMQIKLSLIYNSKPVPYFICDLQNLQKLAILGLNVPLKLIPFIEVSVNSNSCSVVYVGKLWPL